MAQNSWPSPSYNSRNVTDGEYERVMSRVTDDGIDGSPASTAVVSAGVGLQVVVRAGVYGVVRGFAWESGGVDDPLTISSNASGQTRVDWVALQLDRTTWTVRAVVKEGAPGSGSPVLLRENSTAGGTVWELPLALVTVPDGASSVTVRRYEQYIGGRIQPCTSSTRPVLPHRGDLIFETDTGRWLGWDGAAWDVVYSDSGIVVVNGSAAPWDINVDSVVQKRTGSVHLRLGAFDRTGSDLGGGSDSRLPVLIPAAYRHPSRDQPGIVYITGSSSGAGRVIVYSASDASRAGEVWLTNHGGVNSGDAITGSTISWAVD